VGKVKYTNSEAIQTLLNFYRGDWKDILSILIYGIVVGIFALVVPLAAQSLVNTITFGTLIQPLIVITLGVIVFLSLGGVFKILQFIIAERLAQRLMVRVALDLTKWMPELKHDNFKYNFGTEYINRFLEISTVQKSTTFILIDGSTILFQLFFSIVFLGFYHPFFLIFSASVAAILILVVFLFGRAAIPTSMNESDDKYEILASIEDISGAPQLIKSEVGEKAALYKMDYLIHNYLNSRKAHFRVLLSQQAAVVVLQIIGSATLLGVGGLLVIREQLSLGQLVAAELIFTIILSNTDKLTKFLETFYDLVAGIAKLDMLAKLPKENVNKGEYVKDIPIPMSVEFKELTYLHKNGEPVIDNLDFKINAGDKIVIYGGNGSGKSILADLLIGFKFPTKGLVLFNDTSITDLHLNSLRSRIALVRGIEMIHGTLEENLRYVSPSATTREMREVLAKVKLLDDIDQLPEGLKREFKGDYAPLSLGQAERLMIARALLRSPSLLILDGALDSVDERYVDETIEFVLNDSCKSTVVALTRERQFINHFDKRFELKNGKLTKLD
jgi:putative ABC transport system ATP-binding protein